MAIRKVVQIDEEKCNGCGLCIPECPEGALEIVDGKARLAADVYCDGLGACLGNCPKDAIIIIEREAEGFNEKLVKKRMNKSKYQANHTAGHHQCPSSVAHSFKPKKHSFQMEDIQSELSNWPIQITLAPPKADYYENADLLIAADCTPFAYANFHKLLNGKILLIGCPKLDNAEFYAEKITDIIKENNIKSVSVAYMEVPCCYGLVSLVERVIENSGKSIDFYKQKLGIKGDKL